MRLIPENDYKLFMLPNRLLSSFVFFVAGLTTCLAQISEYVRISIPNNDFDYARSWMGVDHYHQKGDTTIVEIPSGILPKLDQNGITYQILVNDLNAFYQDQNKSIDLRSDSDDCHQEAGTPDNFRLGSMGGYLTLEEMKQELDKMHELYPDLITEALPISEFRTYEDRPILWTGITGTGGSGNKKNVLYTGLHHSREPLSMQQMIYFMWYLLENYSQDPLVRKILDNTQLYFIPCVNPDGYAYNSRVSPNGGGMWRKNRRPLANGEYGIDLNRNYGYQWGYNSNGSSNDPSSELYRGSAAFSEPETQAVKWFCENHEIFSALNYHSFGDYLIYPWGYTSESNVHNAHFESLARSLSFDKRILYGTSRETVLYTTNGDADDWMYGETESKNRIFSMTPEVGPAEFGFWPKKDLIEMLCARELNQNLRMAMAPHGYVMMVPSSEPVFYSSTLKFKFYLYPVTLEDGVVQSKITPLTDNIAQFEESFYFFGLGNKEEYTLDMQLKPGMQDGEVVRFVLSLDNGTLTKSDTLSFIYSTVKEEIDVLSRTADIDNWVRSSHSSNSWGSTTSEFYSEPSSITDSPKGLYSTATENSIVSSQSFQIPMEEEVFLTFKAKWDITFGKDYAQLSISTDGVTYTPLCGNLTTSHFNYDGAVSPVYTGIQSEWLTEQISLNNYRGEEVYFKWNLVSESSDARDGIFVDDMKITYSQTITAREEDLVKWEGHELYPNPVKGHNLNLKISSNAGMSPVKMYEIRNQLGQLMGRGQTQVGVNAITVDDYPAGMYFVQLVTNDGQRMEARKFIVMP